MDDEELEKLKGAEGSGRDHSCGWHHGWQEIEFWVCGTREALHQKGAAAFLQQYLTETLVLVSVSCFPSKDGICGISNESICLL